ncbi:MAG: hypothetical protein ACRD5L_16305, partial [Bryobacteraceae bacterium]
TLTVAFTASAPHSGSTCDGAYNGTFKGNLTVSAGQNCIFVGGGVTGNVQQNGGNLTLIQSVVGGNLQIGGASTFNVGPISTINGNFQIQGLPSGAGQNQVCGTAVHGNLQFQNNRTAFLLGSGISACPGNTIGGNLQIQGNSAALQIENNTINGNLQIQSNSAAAQIESNTVAGNLQVQDNTASIMLFSDHAKGNLQCSGNSAIIGGGDTAARKQDQCSAF